MFFVCAMKADEVEVMPDYSYAMAVSPNGRYLVGYNPSTAVSGVGTESFLYDAETASFTWMTSFTGEDWSKAGYFKDVNDAGTICGSVKDMDHVVTFEGVDAPTNIAAVFEKGKVFKLPYGDLDLAKIKQHEDGTFARSISNDGKVVVGYCTCSHSAYNYPCLWTRDGSGQWTFSRLALPEGYDNGVAINVSADGRTIVGLAIKGMESTACYWIDGTCHLVACTAEDAPILAYSGQMRVIDMSPNGRFFIFSISSYYGYRIFDIQKGSYRPLPSFDDSGMSQLPSITNDGDVFGAEKCNSVGNEEKTFYKNYWYQYSSGRIFDFTYYLQLFNPSLGMPFSLSYEDKTQAFPCAVSGDGNVVAGNKDVMTILGEIPKAWMLNVNRKDVFIPATPGRVTGKSTGFRQAAISWKADKTSYESLRLTGYNVYQDGKKIATLNTVTDEMSLDCKDLPAGYLHFSVEGIYQDAQGKQMLSPRSAPAVIAIPENYSLPLFEDFEQASLTANYWTMEKDYGEDADSQWAVGPYLGYGGSIGAVSGAISLKPYSASLVSRPFDAAKLDKVKCSFIFLGLQEMSDDGKPQDLSKDTLSLEYSLDQGETWTSAKDWTIGQMPPMEGVMAVDLTEAVAGHLFQIRLHKHGEGAAKFYFYIDNITVGSGGGAGAPEGFMGKATQNHEVALAWKNCRKSYPLSYLAERPGAGLTLGNEGKELIGANKFTAEELDMYHGKYLTSVTTYINFAESEEEEESTGEEIHAAVVIFEDGKLIREQEIENLSYNENTTQRLSQPVLIDSSKELIVGIRIHDYDADQMPLTYELSKACIPGKSDLFSEDNGATWQTVWDFYAGDPYTAACCWDITANITDRPDDATGQDQTGIIGYNVFRDGLQLNGACIPEEGTRYLDKQPLPKATYHVIAYYADGKESEPSEAVVVELADGISAPAFDSSLLHWDGTSVSLREKGTLTVLSADGRVVARSAAGRLPLAGLPAGIYIVSAECGHQNFSMKIAVRR